MLNTPEEYMKRALELAREAATAGEVPVGALIVMEDGETFEGRNAVETGDPLDHAEMLALKAALKERGKDRRSLSGAVLYVTLEPCVMCLGAMVHARIGGLVFACSEPRFGGVEFMETLWRGGRYPHRFPTALSTESAREESAALMRAFFSAKRSS